MQLVASMVSIVSRFGMAFLSSGRDQFYGRTITFSVRCTGCNAGRELSECKRQILVTSGFSETRAPIEVLDPSKLNV